MVIKKSIFSFLCLLLGGHIISAQREMQYTGIDSVAGTKWEVVNIRMVFGDREGHDSAFADYDRKIYDLDVPDSIVVYVCGELLPLFIRHAADQYQHGFPVTAVFTVGKADIFTFSEPFELLSRCSYQRGVKHGWEYEYYRWKELQGVCVLANFRVKSKGRWKYGQKKGKWVYYDKTGAVLRTETY